MTTVEGSGEGIEHLYAKNILCSWLQLYTKNNICTIPYKISETSTIETIDIPCTDITNLTNTEFNFKDKDCGELRFDIIVKNSYDEIQCILEIDDKNPVCGIRKIKFQKMKRKYPKTIALEVEANWIIEKKNNIKTTPKFLVVRRII